MPAFRCLNRHSARVGQQEFLFFGYILFCAFPVIGCASPWRLCFQIVPPRWWRCFQFVPLRWWLCFQFLPPRCQIYFQTAPHNKTCWWKVESREFVFSIRKSIGKSIRKSDSTTQSVRPILWTQAAADAVHMYTSTAFSIYPPICTIAQAIRNHRTIIVQFTMQLLRKHRTLNLSPKCKYHANIARSMCRQNASIARSICRQSANTVQTAPFLPTFLRLSLQNLSFHPSS